MNYDGINRKKKLQKYMKQIQSKELSNIRDGMLINHSRSEVRELDRILKEFESNNIKFPIDTFRERYVKFYARLTYKQINWIVSLCLQFKIECDRQELNKLMEKFRRQ